MLARKVHLSRRPLCHDLLRVFPGTCTEASEEGFCATPSARPSVRCTTPNPRCRSARKRLAECLPLGP